MHIPYGGLVNDMLLTLKYLKRQNFKSQITAEVSAHQCQMGYEVLHAQIKLKLVNKYRTRATITCS